ncbi:F-box/FBD/LRR-repeat protein At1g16930 [Linum grandiflorum]
MNNCCVYHLRNAAKRAREDAAKRARSADRLSSLPDSILHHILSFLDIKCVVQTSVLSRMWRCVWKHTPVLYFHRDSDSSFRDATSFVRFVNNVLTPPLPTRRLQDLLGRCVRLVEAEI